MKITKARLKKLIREELSYLKEDDMPYKVMTTMSGAPAQFKDLEAAIKTAAIWEKDGFLKPEGTSPEVMEALGAQAGQQPGGPIGEEVSNRFGHRQHIGDDVYEKARGIFGDDVGVDIIDDEVIVEVGSDYRVSMTQDQWRKFWPDGEWDNDGNLYTGIML